jgi:hypothetical protein
MTQAEATFDDENDAFQCIRARLAETLRERAWRLSRSN